MDSEQERIKKSQKIVEQNEKIIKRHYELILSSEEEIRERLSICASCLHLDGNRVCTACGCGVDLKVKKRTTSCPLGKWLATIDLDQ